MNKQTRAASMRPASYDPATNTIEVVWTTGAAVRRYDHRRGVSYDEVLSLQPGHVRLDRLNAGAPLLDTHNDSKLAAILGSVVPGSARIANGQGTARVKLSTSAADAGTVGKIKEGIIRNISVGYAIHAIATSEGHSGADETRTATDWEPLEISAVPVPADAGAQFRSLGHDDSTAAARARMQARHKAVAGSRKLTLADIYGAGRTPWLVPDEERA